MTDYFQKKTFFDNLEKKHTQVFKHWTFLSISQKTFFDNLEKNIHKFSNIEHFSVFHKIVFFRRMFLWYIFFTTILLRVMLGPLILTIFSAFCQQNCPFFQKLCYDFYFLITLKIAILCAWHYKQKKWPEIDTQILKICFNHRNEHMLRCTYICSYLSTWSLI
jgi:hypothetical protein